MFLLKDLLHFKSLILTSISVQVLIALFSYRVNQRQITTILVPWIMNIFSIFGDKLIFNSKTTRSLTLEIFSKWLTSYNLNLQLLLEEKIITYGFISHEVLATPWFLIIFSLVLVIL